MLMNNATAALTMTESAPLLNWGFLARWSDFQLPAGVTLPPGSVIQGIYPVLVCSGTYSGVGVFEALFGVGLDPYSFNDDNSVGITSFELSSINFASTLLYSTPATLHASIGNTLSVLNGQQISIRIMSTVSSPINDSLTVTSVGYAIYYTSATPSDNATQMPVPFPVPAGQQVAWALPVTALADSFGQPTDFSNGSAVATPATPIGPTVFSGITILTMPSDPPAPQTVEWTASDIVAASLSPFTAEQQLQDWQQGWLEASLSMPPLTQKQAQAWIAFLLALRGQLNAFMWGDPLATAPAGSGSGSPYVNGGGQTGFTLGTTGWTANAQGVLLPGDWLQVGLRLYRTTMKNVNADASGNAVINIWPPLRESPMNGTALILTNTKGLFRLKSNVRKWSETEARYYGMQFEIREVLTSIVAPAVLV
jgi:hypothetical protein